MAAADRRQRQPGQSGRQGGGSRPRRRRVPLWVKATAALVAVGLIFRRAIASVVLIALSAALHFVGINVHLPSIRFAWPWQTISAGVTNDTDLGPWVLQKIEGISKPALGQANFNFYFTHKVSKSMQGDSKIANGSHVVTVSNRTGHADGCAAAAAAP